MDVMITFLRRFEYHGNRTDYNGRFEQLTVRRFKFIKKPAHFGCQHYDGYDHSILDTGYPRRYKHW